MGKVILNRQQPKLFKPNLFCLWLSLMWMMGLGLSFTSACQAFDWDIQVY